MRKWDKSKPLLTFGLILITFLHSDDPGYNSTFKRMPRAGWRVTREEAIMKRTFALGAWWLLGMAACWAQPGWHWQNPLPQGNSLYNVAWAGETLALGRGRGRHGAGLRGRRRPLGDRRFSGRAVAATASGFTMPRPAGPWAPSAPASALWMGGRPGPPMMIPNCAAWTPSALPTPRPVGPWARGG